VKLINARVVDFTLKNNNRLLKVIKLGAFRSDEHPDNFAKLVNIQPSVYEKIFKKEPFEVAINRNKNNNYIISLTEKKDNGSLVVLKNVKEIHLPDEAKGFFYIKLSGTLNDGETKDYLCQVKPNPKGFKLGLLIGKGGREDSIKFNSKGEIQNAL